MYMPATVELSSQHSKYGEVEIGGAVAALAAYKGFQDGTTLVQWNLFLWCKGHL